MSNNSDEEVLIVGLKAREESAFEALLDIYGDKILGVCYLILKDMGLSEDVVQEVFIAVYKSIRKFKGKSSLYTWICKIAVNKCRDVLKTRGEYVSYDDFIELASEENVENEALRNTDCKKIRECIFKLKPIYREIITLYYYQELSIKEICDVLDEKENTVKSRLKRGRNLLKENLNGFSLDSDEK